MDFLLACIGFPPSFNFDRLARATSLRGEPVACRGPRGSHLSLPLGGGLEVWADREEDDPAWTLSPHFRPQSPELRHRLRVAVEVLRTPTDSPCDAVLIGWSEPPADASLARPISLATEDRFSGPFTGQPVENSPKEFEQDSLEEQNLCSGRHQLSALLKDGRRLPRQIRSGHVLAISLTGFALHVERIISAPKEHTTHVRPLLGPDDPGGCVELSARVLKTHRLRNPITGTAVQMLEVGGLGRPLPIFINPWQLFEDQMAPPYPGDVIEGTFLLSGQVVGGLPSPRVRAGSRFG